MSLLRIFSYFLGEAALSLRRSWRVSLLATLTIAMSIFVGGTFLLLTGNLGRIVENWRHEAKIIVYLESDVGVDALQRVRDLSSRPEWISTIHEVTGTEANARFRQTFPSVQDMLKSWGDEALPASLELELEPARVSESAFESWLEALREDPAVVMVDEDRDWLRQLDAFVDILRGVGVAVGLALLGAAIITIGSVIRLTAFLYRDEIAVMRLVGATELYIRGPFFFEGLIQGFLGGLVAVSGLYAAFLTLDPGDSTILLGTVLVDRFLPWQAVVALLGLATLAGCLGAVFSLRREDLAAD